MNKLHKRMLVEFSLWWVTLGVSATLVALFLYIVGTIMWRYIL